MRNDISIRLHHVHIITHRANKLLKCLWMMITAFSFSPIKHFCGKHLCLCQTLALEIKVSVLEIFHFLFCTLCGLWLEV